MILFEKFNWFLLNDDRSNFNIKHFTKIAKVRLIAFKMAIYIRFDSTNTMIAPQMTSHFNCTQLAFKKKIVVVILFNVVRWKMSNSKAAVAKVRPFSYFVFVFRACNSMQECLLYAITSARQFKITCVYNATAGCIFCHSRHTVSPFNICFISCFG